MKRGHFRVPTGPQRPKSVQSDMPYDLVTTGCHHQRTCAVTVHFVSALLVLGIECLDNLSFP